MPRLPALPTSTGRRLHRAAAALAMLAAACLAGPAVAAPDEAWQVVGRQGLVQIVIVPAAQAADEAAYRAQLGRLCEPERTCFINFYTNTAQLDTSLPLAAAIAEQATATYRRSSKNGVERLLWACRLQRVAAECF